MAGVEGAAGLDLGAFLTSNTRVLVVLSGPGGLDRWASSCASTAANAFIWCEFPGLSG